MINQYTTQRFNKTVSLASLIQIREGFIRHRQHKSRRAIRASSMPDNTIQNYTFGGAGVVVVVFLVWFLFS